jgi:hydroxyacylglutathione hydrolase
MHSTGITDLIEYLINQESPINNMLIIDRIHAFEDNYIWVLRQQDNPYCVVVDPGQHQPVTAYLETNHLKLEAILITHKHGDHIGGVPFLKQQTNCLVIGPENDGIQGLDETKVEGDTATLALSNISYRVIDVPGHTLGHIAYHIEDNLFCGDTLFVAGCGRVFEGTMHQMYHSLSKLAKLPDETSVYCAHEYTLANLDFAVTVEPNNQDLIHYQQVARKNRQDGQATVPSTLGLEKSINPFLRCQKPAIIQSASIRAGKQLGDPVSVFESIRQWKNVF